MPIGRPLDAGVTLVRPMLAVTRRDVEAWLEEIGQTAHIDETNADRRFTRNRIRTLLLPLLEAEFNPQIRPAIHRLCRQAADVEETLDVLANDLLARAVQGGTGEVIRLDCTALAYAPRHLLRSVLSCPVEKAGLAPAENGLRRMGPSGGTGPQRRDDRVARRGGGVTPRKFVDVTSPADCSTGP